MKDEKDNKNKKLGDKEVSDKIIEGARKSFEILNSKLNKMKNEKDKGKD